MELENNEVDLTDENLNVSLSEEEIQKIESASLEELFESLESIEDIVEDVEGEEAPVDDLGPAMESLMGMMDEIRHSGGISRSDASTLMNMTTSMEGFQDTFRNLPLASFTEVPSKVNYDVSMENIVSRTAKAIIEAIKRAIKWIKEKVTSAKNWILGNRIGEKKAEAAVAKVKVELKRSPVPSKPELVSVAKTAVVAPEARSSEPPKKTAVKTSKLKVAVAEKVSEKVTPEQAVEKTLEEVAADLAGRCDDQMYDLLYGGWGEKIEGLTTDIIAEVDKFLKEQDIRKFAVSLGVRVYLYKGFTAGRPPQVSESTILSAKEIEALGVWLSSVVTDFAGLRYSRRSFEKIKTKDPLVALKDMATFLERTAPPSDAVGESVLRILSDMDKMVRVMERRVETMAREGDTEKLGHANAIVHFLHTRLASVIMAANRLRGEVIAYRAKMAKIVWEWNSSRLDRAFN